MIASEEGREMSSFNGNVNYEQIVGWLHRFSEDIRVVAQDESIELLLQNFHQMVELGPKEDLSFYTSGL